MLDTVGPELQIYNKSEKPIALEVDATVTITPDTKQDASSQILPINFPELAKVGI
jgi:pyruvate kinase